MKAVPEALEAFLDVCHEAVEVLPGSALILDEGSHVLSLRGAAQTHTASHKLLGVDLLVAVDVQ